MKTKYSYVWFFLTINVKVLSPGKTDVKNLRKGLGNEARLFYFSFRRLVSWIPNQYALVFYFVPVSPLCFFTYFISLFWFVENKLRIWNRSFFSFSSYWIFFWELYVSGLLKRNFESCLRMRPLESDPVDNAFLMHSYTINRYLRNTDNKVVKFNYGFDYLKNHQSLKNTSKLSLTSTQSYITN